MATLKPCRECKTPIHWQAKTCPHCGVRKPHRLVHPALVWTVGLVLLMGYAAAKKEPDKPIDQQEIVAEVGDVVSIRYPASTILCWERGEAEKVYLTGELAMRRTWQLENSASLAVEAGAAGRKLMMMRDTFSCRWAPSDTRFRVQHKQITGTAQDAFHTVEYCLGTDDGKQCWWLQERFSASSPFKNVERAAK